MLHRNHHKRTIFFAPLPREWRDENVQRGFVEHRKRCEVGDADGGVVHQDALGWGGRPDFECVETGAHDFDPHRAVLAFDPDAVTVLENAARMRFGVEIAVADEYAELWLCF